MEEQKIENDYNACLMTKSGVANCPLLPFCSYEDLRPGIGYGKYCTSTCEHNKQFIPIDT